MGGSKASSTSEVGNGLPRCGCNETMKLLVSKSIENPGRKFWKCRNYMNGCGLFLWDDLVSEFAVKETNPSGCRQCEVNKAYLIEFAKEIVEEIDCRVGKLNKLEKLKKKIAMEKRKNLCFTLLNLPPTVHDDLCITLLKWLSRLFPYHGKGIWSRVAYAQIGSTVNYVDFALSYNLWLFCRLVLASAGLQYSRIDAVLANGCRLVLRLDIDSHILAWKSNLTILLASKTVSNEFPWKATNQQSTQKRFSTLNINLLRVWYLCARLLQVFVAADALLDVCYDVFRLVVVAPVSGFYSKITSQHAPVG
ncbi:hypothetical protein KIW84_022730 [Lathyrus oleraceus]|uniref:GRF-type domain-containing protein n=2 Tax=Pisum sativum TaxID=3888 RepID=A0A9D4YB72_PEA|nr:hypothetical protein KIW84_022730 [Pisum sativum]